MSNGLSRCRRVYDTAIFQALAERFMMDPDEELNPRGVGPTTEENNDAVRRLA